jgi:hypothetical protein
MFTHFKSMAKTSGHLSQNVDRLESNFRTDPVAGQGSNAKLHGPLIFQRAKDTRKTIAEKRINEVNAGLAESNDYRRQYEAQSRPKAAPYTPQR